MLASEVIKRYEDYCPQELSMEGDVRGLQVGTLQKDIHKVMVALSSSSTRPFSVRLRIW